VATLRAGDEGSLTVTLSTIQVRPWKMWTEHEDRVVRLAWADGKSDAEIALLLPDRTSAAVALRRSEKLGLKRAQPNQYGEGAEARRALRESRAAVDAADLGMLGHVEPPRVPHGDPLLARLKKFHPEHAP
jgi:hypothetical protein